MSNKIFRFISEESRALFVVHIIIAIIRPKVFLKAT